jgi:dihydropteroate synthase
MGILNITPDSFSDGGELPGPPEAVDRAATLVEEGAEILDVGGESTRPGASAVAPAEEMERVAPVLEALAARFDVALSVDTRNAAVAREALGAGAHIVNDVSGLSHDPSMATVVAESRAGLVLMHMRGVPSTMLDHATYEDLEGEVVAELRQAVRRAREGGVERSRIVVDPGLGFAKNTLQNLRLLRNLGRLGELGFPLLVGPSRKRFLGELLGVPPRERVAGTVAASVMAYLEGARIFRVHDVGPVRQALTVAHAVAAGPTGP